MQGRQVLSHSSRLKAAMRRQLRQTPTSVPLILHEVHFMHAKLGVHKGFMFVLLSNESKEMGSTGLDGESTLQKIQ